MPRRVQLFGPTLFSLPLRRIGTRTFTLMAPENQNLSMILTAEEVYGRNLTLSECQTVCAGLDFGAVACYLAIVWRFNEVAFNALPVSPAKASLLTEVLDNMIFDPKARVAARILIAKNTGPFTPISLQAALASFELAGRFCPRQNRQTQLTESEREQMTKVLLSFQGEAFSRKALKRLRLGRVKTWDEFNARELAVFTRNLIANNPLHPYGNSFARLYAYGHRQPIADYFLAKTGRSLDSWFQGTLGMSSREYVFAAFAAGLPQAIPFNPGTKKPLEILFEADDFFRPVPPDVRKRVFALLDLVTFDGNTPWILDRKSKTLEDLLYESNQLHATPVIGFGSRRILVSGTLIANNLAFGLPHASLNSARQLNPAGKLTNSDVARIRGGFGVLLEGYLRWLFREWFSDRPVRLLIGFEALVDGVWCERDIAILKNDCAFLFEIKNHVVDFKLRGSGDFPGLARLVEDPVDQAFTAAEAFLRGEVRDSEGKQVGSVARVFPVALTYDSPPLIQGTGARFERWLEAIKDKPYFTPTQRRARVQMLGIDDVEVCEKEAHMDREPEQLLGLLMGRANSDGRRYDTLGSFRSLTSPPTGPRMPGPISLLISDSKAHISSVKMTFAWPDPNNSAPGAPTQ